MQRFNLLLINSNLGKPTQKAVGRVFRRNYVLEVPSLDEAETLVDKLNMDMILVDLDSNPTDLTILASRYPNLLVWGLAKDPTRMRGRAHPIRNRIFAKRDFEQDMIAELKLVKKGEISPETPKRRSKPQRATRGNDFKNFFQLVGAN